MAKIERKKTAFSTDLTDEGEMDVAPTLPMPTKAGRQHSADQRQGGECHSLRGRRGLWLADAAGAFGAVAGCILIAQAIRAPAAIPHNPDIARIMDRKLRGKCPIADDADDCGRLQE